MYVRVLCALCIRAIPFMVKGINKEINKVSVKKVIAVAMGFALMAIFGISLAVYFLNVSSECARL